MCEYSDAWSENCVKETPSGPLLLCAYNAHLFIYFDQYRNDRALTLSQLSSTQLLIGEKYASSYQEHYPDLESDIHFAGNRWWRRKISAVLSGYFQQRAVTITEIASEKQNFRLFSRLRVGQ